MAILDACACRRVMNEGSIGPVSCIFVIYCQPLLGVHKLYGLDKYRINRDFVVAFGGGDSLHNLHYMTSLENKHMFILPGLGFERYAIIIRNVL